MSDRESELEESLKRVLASLVATTSLLRRAEDVGKKPSKVVGSDMMFAIMLVDYEKAAESARKLFPFRVATSKPKEVVWAGSLTSDPPFGHSKALQTQDQSEGRVDEA